MYRFLSNMDTKKDYQQIMLHISLITLFLNQRTRKFMFLVIFVLTKVFDCVNHELLLFKLGYYDTQSEIFDWFK